MCVGAHNTNPTSRSLCAVTDKRKDIDDEDVSGLKSYRPLHEMIVVDPFYFDNRARKRADIGAAQTSMPPSICATQGLEKHICSIPDLY